MSTSFATTPWQAARIEMPGDRRSWTVLDDHGDVVECLRHWMQIPTIPATYSDLIPATIPK